MLLWLTVGLVLAGTVLLVLGFVENTFGYFYASIACAAIAGLTLVVFSRVNRRRVARYASVSDVDLTEEPSVAASDSSLIRQADPPHGQAAVTPDEQAPAAHAEPVVEPSEDDWDDEPVFPIEDYDDLRVAEILPLLSELDPDELEEVREREAAGQARGSLMRRIAILLGPETTALASTASASQPPPAQVTAVDGPGERGLSGDG